MERKKIKTIAGVALCVCIVLYYISIHFYRIEYRGQKIWVRSFEPFSEVRSGSGGGKVIGTYTLETEFGDIIIKSSCEVSMVHWRLLSIEASDFKTRKAEHNLTILGNRIEGPISISFDAPHQSIKRIWIEQKLPIGRYAFNINAIAPHYTRRYSGQEFVEKILLKIEIEFDYKRKVPDPIQLSDGTEIQNIKTAFLILENNGEWALKAKGRKPLLVKRRQGEFEKYSYIRFEEDWGAFIGGELYEGE